MRCYVYQSTLLCECCGKLQLALLEQAGIPDTGDTNDYPQGPYAQGGGEADCPQHCDHCNVFLENPLTEDGREYVAHVALGGRTTPMLSLWATFYAPHAGVDGLTQWAARRHA